jgi:hypothetical protein
MPQQLDLIPATPFSAIAQANLRRYAIAPVGMRTRTLRINQDAVTACLKAEVDREKIRVRGHYKSKSRKSDAALDLVDA